MKTSTSPNYSNNSTLVTIATLRERAGEMLRVADHLEATEKFLHEPVTGLTLVKSRRKMSAATKKKIAAAQKARHATPVKTAA